MSLINPICSKKACSHVTRMSCCGCPEYRAWDNEYQEKIAIRNMDEYTTIRNGEVINPGRDFILLEVDSSYNANVLNLVRQVFALREIKDADRVRYHGLLYAAKDLPIHMEDRKTIAAEICELLPKHIQDPMADVVLRALLATREYLKSL